MFIGLFQKMMSSAARATLSRSRSRSVEDVISSLSRCLDDATAVLNETSPTLKQKYSLKSKYASTSPPNLHERLTRSEERIEQDDNDINNDNDNLQSPEPQVPFGKANNSDVLSSPTDFVSSSPFYVHNKTKQTLTTTRIEDIISLKPKEVIDTDADILIAAKCNEIARISQQLNNQREASSKKYNGLKIQTEQKISEMASQLTQQEKLILQLQATLQERDCEVAELSEVMVEMLRQEQAQFAKCSEDVVSCLKQVGEDVQEHCFAMIDTISEHMFEQQHQQQQELLQSHVEMCDVGLMSPTCRGEFHDDKETETVHVVAESFEEKGVATDEPHFEEAEHVLNVDVEDDKEVIDIANNATTAAVTETLDETSKGETAASPRTGGKKGGGKKKGKGKKK